MIEAINRAMNALDSYWAKNGIPDPAIIALVHAKLEEHASSCSDDWQALVGGALEDLGYAPEWRGEEIVALTQTPTSSKKLSETKA